MGLKEPTAAQVVSKSNDLLKTLRDGRPSITRAVDSGSDLVSVCVKYCKECDSELLALQSVSPY